MDSLKVLRERARLEGLRRYSRMRKADLERALAPTIVYRGDVAVVRRLGRAYLRTCAVATWEQVGRGRFKAWRPAAWYVPNWRLEGLVPLTAEEADSRRKKMSAAASDAFRRRVHEAASRIGALAGGRLAKAVALGRVEPDEAELIAFKARYRHEHTDYERAIGETGDREDARRSAIEEPIPETWDGYLNEYGFDSDEAKALASMLLDPSAAHPIWFKEAEIAVRRAGLDLRSLTYERIRDAIETWRYARDDD